MVIDSVSSTTGNRSSRVRVRGGVMSPTYDMESDDGMTLLKSSECMPPFKPMCFSSPVIKGFVYIRFVPMCFSSPVIRGFVYIRFVPMCFSSPVIRCIRLAVFLITCNQRFLYIRFQPTCFSSPVIKGLYTISSVSHHL